MGHVYRATDTRLNRAVAIKVLPAHVSSQPQLRERFQREAHAISSLSHPHICTLFDVGTHAGTDYLVMEHLDGETLADRLSRGALPLRDALRYGVEIADALARAHRQGIVHRDLKPANVMLTRSGAKLLDFGLAKTAPPAVVGPDAATEVHRPLTAEGTIVGTFQYMAPEQLEGQEADARTDIFALGALLYEMVTGRRAFEGKTRTSLIAAIVDREPAPLMDIQPATPPAFDHVVRTCLAKDREDRWQSAHDVAAELRWIGSSGSQPTAEAPRVPARRSRERLLWVVVVAVLATVAAVAAYRLGTRQERPAAPLLRADLQVQPPLSDGAFERPFDISPDGKWLVYFAKAAGKSPLYLRSLEQPRSVALPATEGGSGPVFSHDGRAVVFRIGNRWKTADAGGGPVQPLVDCDCWTPSWGADGRIYFANEQGIVRVDQRGGELAVVIPVRRGSSYSDPSLLPSGKRILFAIAPLDTNREAELAVYDLETKQVKVLGSGATPRYLESGHLAYVRGNSLFVSRFEERTLAIDGAARAVESVVRHPVTRETFYSVSGAGMLAYLDGTQAWTNSRMVWVDRSGRTEPLPLPPRPYAHPRLDPDGKSVVFAIREEVTDVWTLDLRRNGVSRLTFVPSENEMPVWMPDGTRVIYSSTRAGEPRAHYVRAADGSGEERKAFSAAVHQHISSVSPDGTSILLTEFRADGAADVLLVSPDGKVRRPLFATPFEEMNAQFSPDGRWIAYTTNESGRHEVYVVGHQTPGRWQISTDGGHNPVWSRDGRQLFYLNGSKMFAVDVTTSPNFSVSVPRMLFEGDFELLSRGDTNYDVAPDGQRFLMVQQERSSAERPVTVVANWFGAVERLAAPDRK
jgi:Tol biopolymer transport system component